MMTSIKKEGFNEGIGVDKGIEEGCISSVPLTTVYAFEVFLSFLSSATCINVAKLLYVIL